MLMREALGYAIHQTRLERGYTITQLAPRSRVSMPYISEVEHGKKEISSEMLRCIADGLGVTVAFLISRSAEILHDVDEISESKGFLSKRNKTQQLAFSYGNL